jgi:hypothetical protein
MLSLLSVALNRPLPAVKITGTSSKPLNPTLIVFSSAATQQYDPMKDNDRQHNPNRPVRKYFICLFLLANFQLT